MAFTGQEIISYKGGRMSFLYKFLFIGFLGLLSFPLAPSVGAEDQTPITIEDPFARASTNNVSAIFMTIHNHQKVEDHLTKATISLDSRVELHDHIVDQGVMKMRAVENIVIPAEDSVVLRPGGLHIMLFDLPKPLEVGENLNLTLIFAKAGAVTIDVPVHPLGKK